MNRLALTAFIDTLFLVVFVFFLLPHNPDEAQAEEAVPPGSVIVIAEWPPGLNYDVDLWVQAPDDAPVGYSNKGSMYFSLLRDDLGNVADVTELNIEYSFSRGVPVGEYTVNLHLFSSHGLVAQIPVHVEILLRRGTKHVMIHESDVTLTYQGQELTVWRWTLDDQQVVVDSSLIPKALRSRAPPGGYGG